MGGDQRRAILAVVLSGVVLFGWQYFFGPKVPVVDNKDSLNSSLVKSSDLNAPKDKSNVQNKTKDIESSDSLVADEKLIVNNFTLKKGEDSYTVDNYLNLLNATYSNTSKKLSEVFTKSNSGQILFNINGLFQKLYFNFEQISDQEISISNKDLMIAGKLFLDEKGLLNLEVKSQNSFKYSFRWSEKEQQLDNGQLSNFVLFSKDLETYSVGSGEKGEKAIEWAGIDFNYHLLAVIFSDKQNFLYNIQESGRFDIQSSKPVNNLNFKYVFTKKEYDHLISLGDKLEMSVDFGIWSIIAVPILRGLQFFFSVIPNYGISIILLTLIIRMLTFPLQYKSFKSMKKMQDIQPELTKVREKFKDNPQKMQQETMALFKKAGANPLSGCLPLLLQMPIFFAFYKVLYSAVELVDAPFYLWISDLSEKDPYYVLPVLMALSMFLQQKFTPTTTADPVQKKVMMFMPLLFGLFMKDLPAGLTLYIFVSTLVGMAQQLLVFKRT